MMLNQRRREIGGFSIFYLPEKGVAKQLELVSFPVIKPPDVSKLTRTRAKRALEPKKPPI